MANVESPSAEIVNEMSQNSGIEISVGSNTHDDDSANGDNNSYNNFAHFMKPPTLQNTLSTVVVIADNDVRGGYESDSNNGGNSMEAPKPAIDQKSDQYSISDVNDDVLFANGNQKGYRVETAMVVMLGIGYYDDKNGTYCHLEGVPTDYRNMINLFVKELNYSFLYQTDDSKVTFLTKAELIKLNDKYETNFKIKWSSEDIINFITNCKSIIKKQKSDSLILIISSNCDDTNTCIIDSDSKKFSLNDIYNEFNDDKDGLPYLRKKPKIFIVDTPYNAPIENNNNNNNNNNDNKDNDQKENINNNKNSNYDYELLKGFKDFCFIFNNLGTKGGKEGGYLCNSLREALKKDSLKKLKDKNARELKSIINFINEETNKLAKASNDDNIKKINTPITYKNNIDFDVNFT